MGYLIFLYSYSWNFLSWEKLLRNLHRVQKRLFKLSQVGDLRSLLVLQKILLNANFARLLAIREVTQISSYKKIAGIDGKTSLTFTERFELCEFLKYNFNNWKPQNMKKISFLTNDLNLSYFKIPTISDRVWQCLLQFSIEPVHEALFSPYNLGFRHGHTIYDIQKVLFLNLGKESLGSQKRLLRCEFFSSLISLLFKIIKVSKFENAKIFIHKVLHFDFL